MRFSSVRFFILFMLTAALITGVCQNADSRTTTGPLRLPINTPWQITSETGPVRHAAVSRDGRWIVYSAAKSVQSAGFDTDLWLRPVDMSDMALSRQLTNDSSMESDPVFSDDGRFIAYAGTGHDVKGDIYLIDLSAKDIKPVRLTGRKTGDGGPCFSKDGKKIYFHQSGPGQSKSRLSVIDIKDNTKISTISEDGAFPAISPDGRYLAFISFQADPAGDIALLDLETKKISPLTRGQSKDTAPIWSADGNAIFFSRFSIDTNRDNQINEKDNPVVYRLDIKTAVSVNSWPLTSFSIDAVCCGVSKSDLYFISSIGGVKNCWSLPIQGQIPALPSAKEQVDLASAVAQKIPFDPFLSLLAWYKAGSEFFDQKDIFAEALYNVGRIYQKIEMPHAALTVFESVKQGQPWASLARIQETIIQTRDKIEKAANQTVRRKIFVNGLSALESISKRFPHVKARAGIEIARLRYEQGRTADDYLTAISLLDNLLNDPETKSEEKAEALVLKADIFAALGRYGQIRSVYVSVLKKYPDQSQWADIAVLRILNQSTSRQEELVEKIRILREIVGKNKTTVPILAIGALNRIGDLYFAANDWTRAKNAYQEVVNRFVSHSSQAVAARLSLAEILFKEKRYRQALSLYETEIEARPYEDWIYNLARVAYIQKSIAAGRSQFRMGELPAAAKTFKELIDYEYETVEAHRGYIMCAAAMGRIKPVLDNYKKLMEDTPADPISTYATALCLTYLEDEPSYELAKNLLNRAIRLNGRIEYFHQTSGYVLEVLETVYNKKDHLEKALESYQRAWFLNDHKENAANAAHLLLNLGNINFLLGQYKDAFRYYSQRLEYGEEFNDIRTEILFYRRLGASAFQAGETEGTVTAFEKALELIDAQMNPNKVFGAFDRISRYVMDRIIAPATRQEKTKNAAGSIAKMQSGINTRIFRLSGSSILPPPDPQWKDFTKKMDAAIEDQNALIPKIISLVRNCPAAGIKEEDAKDTLASLVLSAKKRLDFPEKLVELKTEMMDRMGLALQESGKWDQAAKIFETVYELNLTTEKMDNLSRNRRSVAYNEYMSAGSLTGESREKMLTKAARDFASVIELVETHGVPVKQKTSTSSGLIGVSTQVALDETSSTSAGSGFTKDQEIRLARAFISRIETELDRLVTAQIAIDEQLDRYPDDKPVADKDAYGVSLLFHRAGHLAVARVQFKKAFSYFKRSATLSSRLGNAVSTTINVKNMAYALTKIPTISKNFVPFKNQLKILDRKTQSLIAKESAVAGTRVAAKYHNDMGVYAIAGLSREEKKDMKSRVLDFMDVQLGVRHFSQGISIMEKIAENQTGSEKKLKSQKDLALFSVLNLNMADLAISINEPERALNNLDKALKAADTGRLPHLKWRALAGLGKFDEALLALDEITIFNAGCGPDEIINAMYPEIAELVKSGQAEEAFNLAEQLSEIERFHRMASLVGDIPEKERKNLRRLYPRLQKLRELNKKIKDAPKGKKEYLAQRIKQEEEIIAAQSGKLMPDILEQVEKGDRKNRLMIVTGLAAEIEALRSQMVSNSQNKGLKKKYKKTLSLYKKEIEAAVNTRDTDEAADQLTLLGPEPVEAYDIMEQLPENGMMIRVIRSKNSAISPVIVFFVTPDDIKAEIKTLTENILSSANFSPADLSSTDKILFISCEDPFILPDIPNAARSLSATHWYRSFMNKKPFRRALVAIPGISTTAPDNFDLTTVEPELDGQGKKLLAHKNVHTLLLSDSVFLNASVPTRAGDLPEYFEALVTKTGQRIEIQKLFSEASGKTGLSLGLMPETSEKDAYLTGHLAAIYGCPAIILPQKIAAEQPGDEQSGAEESGDAAGFVDAFLKAYQDNSAIKALNTALKTCCTSNERWILLGDPGMSSRAAAVFAGKNFKKYVKQGKISYKAKRYKKALDLFEAAITVAKEVKKYKKYLSVLYRLARESAFFADNLEKAEKYATSLVALIEKIKPDSKNHAEALLRLGIIHAKLETYEKAVPILEEAVDILANLEIDSKQAEALTDLGIVLENAFEYDRALDQFKSALSLSSSANKKELLAIQYMNIGRIYDMRMSRYAAAMLSYKKGLAIFEQKKDIGNIIQARIDVGRCFRLTGNFAEAAQYYESAVKLAEKDPKKIRLLAKAVIEQSNNAWYQARYEDAFKLQRKAFAIAKQENWPLMRVIAKNTSGLIWWTLGKHEKALYELRSALNTANHIPNREDEVATTLNNIGQVQREAGQYKEALNYFKQAYEIDKKMKSRWAIAHDLRNMGQTYLKMRQADKALPLLTQAVAKAHETGNRINETRSLLWLGNAWVAKGNKVEAKKAFEQALALSEKMALHEIRWRALFGLAGLNLTGGREQIDRAKASSLLTQAMEIIEGMRAAIKIDLLKDSFIENKLAVYETLAALLADMGKTEESFEIAERSRSRNFIDLLGNQQLRLNRHKDQKLYDSQKLIRTQIAEHEALVAQAMDEKELTTYKKGLEKLQNEYENLMLEIQAANPGLASLVTVNPVNADQIRKRLDPDVALLAYYLLPDEIFCWVVKKDEIRLFRTPVGRNTLGQTIMDYRRMIQNLEPADDTAAQLHKWLIDPMASYLEGVKTLGIIPNGRLHYLSFATLTNQDNYLIDRFTLFYLPSASVLDYTIKRRMKEKNLKVLAIGNPDLGDATLDLPFAEYEVESTRWNFPDITILTRDKAKESWVKNNIKKFGIIYMATHGEFDPVNPLFSSIKLTRDIDDDGNLETSEVFALDINADMVVLSACQTGLGKVTGGDEVIGLNRAFFYAGAHTVISSLWRVSDISTAIMIKQFYRKYLTANKAESLQNAILHVRQQYPHPGYWGAFTLAGDYY
ncbi:CHAT domain-containing protein [Desulfobacterales bacterium HSG16]|nr:CHAT domain-containing protein [Desulfobacterales bacterium HSG16]